MSPHFRTDGDHVSLQMVLVILMSLGLMLHLRTTLVADELSWRASGKGGAIAAGGAQATAAGYRLLRDGGNAADAAAATLLALAVTDYGMFAIGGEIPLLIYDSSRREVKVLCGLGGAPLDPEAIRWFYENDIPSRGSMKSAPVPGAVDLCVTLLRIYGTRSFGQAVTPTLELLDSGDQSWHKNLAKTLRRLVATEREAQGTREQKLTAARDRFYKGDIADELEQWYRDTGAFLRKGDLASHVTRVEDPVSVTYRGYRVYKCGPWTQGPVLCQALRLLEGFPLEEFGHLSASYIHVVTESLKLAFADRDQYYGDPRFVNVPMVELLSNRYTRGRRELIALDHASSRRLPGDPRGLRPLLRGDPTKGTPNDIPIQDTTTCVVADRWGNVVAATPSCNLVGNKPGPLGVTQGNRVRSLNTTANHPNRLQPGKRPRITLTPTLVTKKGKPVVAISVAGGDLQDQTTLNVLLNHVEFGMLPEQAVTAARFHTSHHENSFDPNPDRQAAFVSPQSLRVNSDVAGDVIAELEKRGHKVSTTPGPIAHPVMIYLEQESGTIYAAGDPRTRRHAAALE